MHKKPKVVFCGTSLIVAGLQASLSGSSRIETIWLEATPPDFNERLRSLRPDAIVLDPSDTGAGLALTIVRGHPGVPVISFDMARNTATVLSCQEYQASTASDLARVLEQESMGARPARRRRPRSATP
jgi:hypothetical protein